MSLIVATDKGNVRAEFTGYPIDGVGFGKYDIPLDHFCAMASHFLAGGFFGWGGETPGAMSKALSDLFEIYERVDGKWVRKAKYSVENGFPKRKKG